MFTRKDEFEGKITYGGCGVNTLGNRPLRTNNSHLIRPVRFASPRLRFACKRALYVR